MLRLQINFCQHFKILEGTTEQLCTSGLLYDTDLTGVALPLAFFAFLSLHIQFVLKLKRILEVVNTQLVDDYKKKKSNIHEENILYLQILSCGFKVVV